jgi:hypothetical protein
MNGSRNAAKDAKGGTFRQYAVSADNRGGMMLLMIMTWSQIKGSGFR